MASEQQYPSVWTRPQRRRREQPMLSREQIVVEALKLLDADGIEALSMRRLGAALNAGATSMYTHVANKEELIELVVDAVLGELEIPELGESADWREAATACAHSLRATILRHPWIVSVLDEVGTSFLGPNMMRMTEGLLVTYEAAGFSLTEADQAIKLTTSYVIGLAAGEAATLTRLAKAGWSEQDWMDRQLPFAEQFTADYPRMTALYAEYRGVDTEKAREESFEYGLVRILDGLGARLS